jgi:hypothetical protein
MPLRQVKVEYDQYELRRRLVSQFDLFLSDGRIAGHMLQLLGKEVYKRRKWVSCLWWDFILIVGRDVGTVQNLNSSVNFQVQSPSTKFSSKTYVSSEASKICYMHVFSII